MYWGSFGWGITRWVSLEEEYEYIWLIQTSAIGLCRADMVGPRP